MLLDSRARLIGQVEGFHIMAIESKLFERRSESVTDRQGPFGTLKVEAATGRDLLRLLRDQTGVAAKNTLVLVDEFGGQEGETCRLTSSRLAPNRVNCYVRNRPTGRLVLR